MAKELYWWTVATDCGTRRTLAPTRAKAVRNTRFRVVMDGRSYSRPKPRDFAAMRDLSIISVRKEGARNGARFAN